MTALIAGYVLILTSVQRKAIWQALKNSTKLISSGRLPNKHEKKKANEKRSMAVIKPERAGFCDRGK